MFQVVLAGGPISAADIARQLGVTPAAVRRHLDSMVEAGVLTDARPATLTPRRGRGRPARAYVVTGAGQRAAASSYEDVALSAVDHLERTYGAAAVTRFIEDRAETMATSWRERVDAAGHEPLDRVRALAAALDGDGYAAGVRVVERSSTTGPVVTGAQLCQGHCPVSSLATRHPDLCEAETRAFSRVLGLRVQRLATIAHGDHVCTTFIPHPPRGEHS